MNKRTLYLRKDRLIRGITEDGFFQVAVVKTTDVIREAQQRHQLSPLATIVLGRALTGVMLLSSELKGEERVQLVLQGNGPLGMVTAEANSIGEIRGYVQNPDASVDLELGQKLEDGIGIGLLSYSKSLYNEARPITGTVELISGNVSRDVAHYLLQSEQVRSAVTLDVQLAPDGSVSEAGGILIKALPGANDDGIAVFEKNLKEMPPVGQLIEHGLYIDDIMHQVANPLAVRELTRTPVHFYCRCNKDRFVVAMNMLQVAELEEMSAQDQQLVCHYCNEQYTITRDEIDNMISAKKVAMN